MTSPAHVNGLCESDNSIAGRKPRRNSTDLVLKLPGRGLCDERELQKKHGQWNEEFFAWNLAPPGFTNLGKFSSIEGKVSLRFAMSMLLTPSSGNTCFLNSILQCMAYCPPICQSIIAAEGTTTHINENGLTTMLGILFRQVHGLDATDGNGGMHSGQTISPTEIFEALQLQKGDQGDASELLQLLLESMCNYELLKAGIDLQHRDWEDRYHETTLAHRVFGGYTRSTVCCTECPRSSNKYELLFHLLLEIGQESCGSITAALANLTRKETLDSWACSSCGKLVCATKQLTVFRPPLALCVQLKRFSYDQLSGVTKITSPIECTASLSLPLSDGRSCDYSLTGMVVHEGLTASSGHYTAYVKKPGKNRDDKWYHMDDAVVREVAESQVLKRGDAYMLLYCCTNPGSSVAQTPSGSTNRSLTVAANEVSSLQKRQITFTSPISSAAVDSGMVTGGIASTANSSRSSRKGRLYQGSPSGSTGKRSSRKGRLYQGSPSGSTGKRRSAGSTGKRRSAAGAGGRSGSATIRMAPKDQITSTIPQRSAVSVHHSVISDLCARLQALGRFLHVTFLYVLVFSYSISVLLSFIDGVKACLWIPCLALVIPSVWFRCGPGKLRKHYNGETKIGKIERMILDKIENRTRTLGSEAVSAEFVSAAIIRDHIKTWSSREHQLFRETLFEDAKMLVMTKVENRANVVTFRDEGSVLWVCRNQV
jgi:ubiquitin C-terminal hydrolase